LTEWSIQTIVNLDYWTNNIGQKRLSLSLREREGGRERGREGGRGTEREGGREREMKRPSIMQAKLDEQMAVEHKRVQRGRAGLVKRTV
jgi:hypothetical protein